ncbi:MAG: hypothetical protein K2H91_13545, partial [Lachnospiraceae bacterium]|nr:hypothetical protein [Lachnospiraceae bacterium]
VKAMRAQRRGRRLWFLMIGFVSGIGIDRAVAWSDLYLHREAEDAAISETVMTAVDYPFSYSTEGWSLVLCEMAEGSMRNGREFRLYDDTGKLVQVFPCGIAKGELTYRFDRLFHYYGYDKDLIIFPADAADTGAMGLCYPWEEKENCFSIEPVQVPWYQECEANDNVFWVSKTAGNVKMNTLCRINEESRQVVELHKWTLTAGSDSEEDSGKRELLHIWDCLEQKDIYFGYVERDQLGNLVNDQYYQFLFRNGLQQFWQWENSDEIKLCCITENGVEYLTYADREALLAAYGFEGEKPFYEYHDQFQNRIVEMYFDAKKGQGCGMFYDYNYNYDLEKVTRCWGFCFDEVVRGKWDEDTFSTLSYDGRDARRSNVSGYQENYVYTDDGMLSSFEARGTVVDYGEGDPSEESLLSMEYIYRDDKTLYFKHYHHHHILFGTSFWGQDSYYDEQGRLAQRYAYVTHGSYNFFYIYEGNSVEPAYCLWLDMNGGNADAVMTAY